MAYVFEAKPRTSSRTLVDEKNGAQQRLIETEEDRQLNQQRQAIELDIYTQSIADETAQKGERRNDLDLQVAAYGNDRDHKDREQRQRHIVEIIERTAQHHDQGMRQSKNVYQIVYPEAVFSHNQIIASNQN